MIRSIVAVVLCVAFEASALTLPFLHAHTDDHASAHHAAHAVHSHFASHASHHLHSTSPVIDDDDDDDQAVYLQLFVAVSPHPMPVGGTALTVFELPTPAERPVQSPVVVVHGHDPPLSGSLAPRPPPPFLS